MSDFHTSLIRTTVPLIVGFLLTQLLKLGVDIDKASLENLVQAGVTAVYYGVVRWAETHKPKAGVLLGVPKAPAYDVPPNA